jgi:hypothetical protein
MAVDKVRKEELIAKVMNVISKVLGSDDTRKSDTIKAMRLASDWVRSGPSFKVVAPKIYHPNYHGYDTIDHDDVQINMGIQLVVEERHCTILSDRSLDQDYIKGSGTRKIPEVFRSLFQFPWISSD